jgi:hypothetical protein
VLGSCHETVVGDRICLYRKFRLFVAFEVIQNNVRLHINTRDDYKMMGLHGKKEVLGRNNRLLLFDTIRTA